MLECLFCAGVNKPAVTSTSAIRDTSHLIEIIPRKNSMELRNETQAAVAYEGMQPLLEFHYLASETPFWSHENRMSHTAVAKLWQNYGGLSTAD